jgi:hypothetical protein
MATASTTLNAYLVSELVPELVSEAVPVHWSNTRTAAYPDGHVIPLPRSSNDSSESSHDDSIASLSPLSEGTSGSVRILTSMNRRTVKTAWPRAGRTGTKTLEVISADHVSSGYRHLLRSRCALHQLRDKKVSTPTLAISSPSLPGFPR